MTKIPVDQASAGPTLDVAIAEARGWQTLSMDAYVFWVTYNEHGYWVASGYLSILPDQGWIEDPLPVYGEKGLWAPSTDIAAAWELTPTKGYIKVIDFKYGYAECDWYEENAQEHFYGNADTAPLAIVRAYLKANGVETVDIREDA